MDPSFHQISQTQSAVQLLHKLRIASPHEFNDFVQAEAQRLNRAAFDFRLKALCSALKRRLNSLNRSFNHCDLFADKRASRRNGFQLAKPALTAPPTSRLDRSESIAKVRKTSQDNPSEAIMIPQALVTAVSKQELHQSVSDQARRAPKAQAAPPTAVRRSAPTLKNSVCEKENKMKWKFSATGPNHSLPEDLPSCSIRSVENAAIRLIIALFLSLKDQAKFVFDPGGFTESRSIMKTRYLSNFQWISIFRMIIRTYCGLNLNFSLNDFLMTFNEKRKLVFEQTNFHSNVNPVVEIVLFVLIIWISDVVRYFFEDFHISLVFPRISFLARFLSFLSIVHCRTKIQARQELQNLSPILKRNCIAFAVRIHFNTSMVTRGNRDEGKDESIKETQENRRNRKTRNKILVREKRNHQKIIIGLKIIQLSVQEGNRMRYRSSNRFLLLQQKTQGEGRFEDDRVTLGRMNTTKNPWKR